MSLHLTKVIKESTTDVHLYEDATAEEVEATIEREIKAGHCIEYMTGENRGTRVFQIDDADEDHSKQGSAAYIWDKSGNKARHTRYRVTRKADGTETRDAGRKLYKAI